MNVTRPNRFELTKMSFHRDCSQILAFLPFKAPPLLLVVPPHYLVPDRLGRRCNSYTVTPSALTIEPSGLCKGGAIVFEMVSE
jgi:hypothetical protein